MKRILTLLLLPVVAYLSSCSNNSGANLKVTPTYDSVSKGGFVDVSFGIKTFAINDLIVNNSAVYTMTASMNNVAPDSFWSSAIVLTDHTNKQVSMNLSVFRDSTSSLGIYFVTTNNSTLTDYSAGSNQTYSVLIGSSVTITSIGSNYVTGTLNLNLAYDHDTSTATGGFKIIH